MSLMSFRFPPDPYLHRRGARLGRTEPRVRLPALPLSLLTLLLASTATLLGGGYSAGLDDPANGFDAPVPGFVGPDGEGLARLPDGWEGFSNERNYVNPLFFGWATGHSGYYRSDSSLQYSDAALALGPVTGDTFDVVSLGDLPTGSTQPGTITLSYSRPLANLPGADFVVFENGTYSLYTTPGGSVIGQVWAELAYVEVSSDGLNFARFPSRSLTANPVGAYGTLDPTNVYNLAGKHVNAFGESWGTPFDLEALKTHPLVGGAAPLVDLGDIRYVRIVDVPGTGSFLDDTGAPIYDAWLTVGSGGFDLEAVGAVSVPLTFAQWQIEQGLSGAQLGQEADPDGDGVANLLEFALGMQPLRADAELAPTLARVGAEGRVALDFRRDTRATDVLVEIEASPDLTTWQVIARASGPDGALMGVAPHAPSITDTSASHIASVGVIRRQVVTDSDYTTSEPQRYLRLKATLLVP